MKIKSVKTKTILGCSTRSDAGKTYETENTETTIGMKNVVFVTSGETIEIQIHEGDCRINHATNHDVTLTMTRDEFKKLLGQN